MKLLSKQQGFTLIELMITVVIIAILAAIAVPTYREIIIKNAESSATAQMGQFELQLERWKASSLSYRGFIPSVGVDNNNAPIFRYDNRANTLIFVPLGSNANNYRYQINIFDGGTNNTSLVSGSGIDIGAGRSWVMVATPNPDGVAGGQGKVFVQRSTGMKCLTSVSNTAIATAAAITNCTGANWEVW